MPEKVLIKKSIGNLSSATSSSLENEKKRWNDHNKNSKHHPISSND